MDNPIGLILAGGQSSRMGGTDKGLITLHGKPLISHTINRLIPQVSQLLISANRNADVYRQFGYPVIEDALPGYQGPLAGILGALHYLQRLTPEELTAYCQLLIAPVDAPQLPLDLYARLSHAISGSTGTATSITVAHDGCRQQSLFMLLSIGDRNHLDGYCDSLQQSLDKGERKVEWWLKGQHCIEVDFSDEADCFSNINTPDDLTRVTKQIDAG